MIFYTYLWLREDGSPYYVGKGTRARAFRRGSPPRERIIVEAHASEADAFDAERFLIAYYGRKDNASDPGILINHTDGGDGVSNPSEEVREQHRRVAISFHTGRVRSKKTRERLQKSWNHDASRRHVTPHTDETKKNISSTLKQRGIKPKQSPEIIARRAATYKGHKHTQAARDNMRAAALLRHERERSCL